MTTKYLPPKKLESQGSNSGNQNEQSSKGKPASFLENGSAAKNPSIGEHLLGPSDMNGAGSLKSASLGSNQVATKA